jgi:hypothetical protein
MKQCRLLGVAAEEEEEEEQAQIGHHKMSGSSGWAKIQRVGVEPLLRVAVLDYDLARF